MVKIKTEKDNRKRKRREKLNQTSINKFSRRKTRPGDVSLSTIHKNKKDGRGRRMLPWTRPASRAFAVSPSPLLLPHVELSKTPRFRGYPPFPPPPPPPLSHSRVSCYFLLRDFVFSTSQAAHSVQNKYLVYNRVLSIL